MSGPIKGYPKASDYSLTYRFLSGMLDALDFAGHCIVVGFTGCLFIAATLLGAVVALGLVLIIIGLLARLVP